MEWTDRMCLFRCSLRLKAFSQLLHLKGLASSSSKLIGVTDLETECLLLAGVVEFEEAVEDGVEATSAPIGFLGGLLKYD